MLAVFFPVFATIYSYIALGDIIAITALVEGW